MKRAIIALFALMIFVSCANNTTPQNQSSNSAETKAEMSSVVEVLYMHGKQRCATCIAIGAEAEAYVKELANENVVMKTIDFSTEEGEKIADKYEVASSSLIIVKGDKVENLTAMSFQYARNNPKQFKKNLAEAIQKMVE